MKTTEIEKYIKAIHNKNKKQYAIAYYNYLCSNKQPAWEPEDKNLSYMAKQAVRMNITKLFEIEEQENINQFNK
jgi:hypothetical protein